MRRLRLSPAAWITLAVILVATAFVFIQLQPRLLFRATTPSGGDMGAHVWGPAYLRDHLLPHGRLTGWTPDWYLGFPALVFYFPLPSLLIALLSHVLPYGVAFKLVTVLGLLTLPTAAWAMGKLAGMKDPIPVCLAVAMVPFLFDRTYTIYGGNIASTLAGEFAFSISLSLALVFIGVFARGLRTGRHRAWSAALLAVTALCHVVPAFFAVGAAGVLLLVNIDRLDRRRLVYAVQTFVVSGLIAAFWVVPFLARIAYTNDMGWEKITAYRQTLIPHDARGLVLLAMMGAVVSLALRRRTGLFLTLLAVGSAAAFVTAPQSRLWNARLLPFWTISLYLLAGVLAGEIGRALGLIRFVPAPATVPAAVPLYDQVGELDADELGVDPDDDIGYFGAPLPEPTPKPADEPDPIAYALKWLVPIVALVVALVYVALPLRLLPYKTADRSFIPDWVRWNYTGYEGKASYPEYHNVVQTMDAVGRQHGCGRAMWEYEPELDRLGTPMALMLLPYWTDGCIGSMEGLFFESSATTPYHFLNQAELSAKPSSAQRALPYRTLDLAKGVPHLQLLGVRYYMAISPEAQAQARANPDLELLATSGPWNVTYSRPDLSGVKQRTWEVYRVKDAELVAPLANKPAVMQGVAKGGKPWLDAAVSWYQDDQRWDVPLAVSGPADWPRVQGANDNPPRDPVPPAVVSNIKSGDDRISFDVDQPGTPVLVKASYFPNWQASGAKGPWRVTPNLMVVVPTGRHVELHYGFTPVDGVAWGLTLLGLAGLGWLMARRRETFDADRTHNQE
ncbi:MAG TPA: 6-pyruvoyl-tetrahydropterin synthase-related protein [Acidimicrobiales bacterium]|jgi:hypothetical protein|nr:6-pyruvoyl-tetrahydropterin synthase-related protein [Acidimicrobiales bacterium]